jgi:hypothetical protein
MPIQSIRAIESIETAIINRVLYISVSWLLSLRPDPAEKGTLGSVGAEKETLGSVGAERFRVELVPLSYKGKGKRRDGLVGNRGNCEPLAPVVVSTIVEVVVFLISTIVEVVVVAHTSLLTLFVTLLSCRWNNASEHPTSTKKYKDLIAEGLVFICDTGTALLICVS